MEICQFSYSVNQTVKPKVQVQVGVVASGDLEVLLVSDESKELKVSVISSADNSKARWDALFKRLVAQDDFFGAQMTIHDFGATPGVARLRIEQSLEEARHD